MSGVVGDADVLNLQDLPRSGCRWSIDWLEVSVKTRAPSYVRQLVCKRLGDSFDASCWSVVSKEGGSLRAQAIHDVQLRADSRGSENRFGEREPWVSLRFPGKACQAVGTPALLMLLVDLRNQPGMKVSRLDVALDDFDRQVTPRQFAETAVEGSLDDERARLAPSVVTRVRGQNWNWDRRKGGCFWLGRGGSERSLRIYDKAEESQGRIPSVRLELQCRNRAATKLALGLLSAQEHGRSMPAVIARHLVSFVDFRKPSGSRSSSQSWPRIEWWEQMIGAATRLTLEPREAATVARWQKQIGRQCRGFLEVLLQAHGSSLDAIRAENRAGRYVSTTIAAMAAALLTVRGDEAVVLTPVQRGRLAELRADQARVGEELPIRRELVELERLRKQDRERQEWRESVLGNLDPNDEG